MKTIQRINRVHGEVTAPASKSFTARALLLAASTVGETRVVNALDCDDARYMLDAIRAIGWEVSGSFAKEIVIGARVGISSNEVEIHVGNAGTAMRFLTGFLAFTPGRFLLSGERRMHERPIGDLVDALLSIGAEIEYVEREGFPPLRFRGKIMRGGFDVSVSGETSSQFVSSLMLAATRLPGGLRLHVDRLSSRPYVDVTRSILMSFGATVSGDDTKITVGSGELRLDRYVVEGDFSSASYWFAAAAATHGTVVVHGLHRSSAQGDRAFLDILGGMGCEVLWSDDSTVSVTGPERLRGGRFDCNATPDIVPTLAAIAPLAMEPVEIVNVATLRVKESDRIAAIASELRKLGAVTTETADSITIHPAWGSDECVIDPHGDHRIAMSMAIAGLARGGVKIDRDDVVSKSYPGFWRVLERLGT